jgi:hypothetical protein
MTVQTTGYSLTGSDANTWVRYNLATTGAIFTIPADAQQLFPTGTSIIMDQMGTGRLTLAPSGGVALENATPGLITRAQYSAIAITKAGTNTWIVTGDTSAT